MPANYGFSFNATPSTTTGPGAASTIRFNYSEVPNRDISILSTDVISFTVDAVEYAPSNTAVVYPTATQSYSLQATIIVHYRDNFGRIYWVEYTGYGTVNVTVPGASITSFTSSPVNGSSILVGQPITAYPVIANASSARLAESYSFALHDYVVTGVVSGGSYTLYSKQSSNSLYYIMVFADPGGAGSTLNYNISTPYVENPTMNAYVTIGYTSSAIHTGSPYLGIYSPTHTWSSSGGKGSINSSGVFTASSLGVATITSTWSNNSGSWSGSISTTVVAAPIANGLTSSLTIGYVTNGDSFTLYPVFSGGTGVIDHGVGAVISGSGYTVTQAGGSSATYTLTVTNLAGTTATTTYGVVYSIAPPAISSFAASPATIVVGGFTTLTPIFSTYGGSQTISGVGPVTTGVGYTVHPTVTTTYTLSISNAAGTVVTATTTVIVNSPPSISNFTISNNNPLYGDTITLTPYFSSGTATIGTTGSGSSNVTSSATSGVGVTHTPYSPTTYTLTASNGGLQVTATITSTPQTVAVSSPSPTTVIGTGLSRTFSASVSGAANTSVSWSHSGVSGSWSGSAFTPSSAGTVRITATSVADSSKSAYSDVIIVDPPTVTFTTSNANPLRGTTGIVITPTYNGVSAIVGTSPGDNSISGSATSGTPITVQGSGFVTTTTYWVRTYNAAGLYTDASVTVTAQIVSVSVAGGNSFAQGGSGNFTASVTGAMDSSVNWSVDGGSGYGTFSGNTYTAPIGAGVPANATIRATAVADTSKSGSKLIIIQAVSVNTITPTGASLSTLATQSYTATVSGATNPSVSWTTNFGTINSAGLYTAPNTSGTATITATSISDPSKTLSTTATITATPSISSFSSSTPSPLVGQSYTVTPVYSNGSGIVDRLIGPLASGVASNPVIAGLSPVTYTLTVTNNILISTTSTLVVTPQTIGVTLSPSSISINGATTQQFTAVISGVINTAVIWSIDGGSVNGTISSMGLYTSPSASPGSPITVRATSVADPTKSATATVTITTIVVSLGQSSATVTATNTFSTTATVTGSSNIAVTWSATGGGVVSGSVYTAPASPGTFMFRATSVADPTKHADCSITVVRMPAIGAFTSTSLTPLFGSSVSLSGIFGDGVGAIDGGIGPVTSGANYLTPALNVPITYTLTVTNAAGSYVSRSLTMIPTSLSITVNPSSYVAVVGEVFTFTATVLLAGAGSNGKTWSTSGGSIGPSTGVFTAPATPTPIGSPITVTATSVADSTKYSTALVSVVYPIYSGKKSATSSS